MFHLVTHAFFKAMLFLGSGSVIHAMEEVVGHEPVLAQDMRLMGGLRKYMPITSTTFFIGCHGHQRHPAPGGLLEQGRDPGPGLWQLPAAVGGGLHHRRH
jgi:NAD(P)H-quinone oxidoreductase subunit 5